MSSDEELMEAIKNLASIPLRSASPSDEPLPLIHHNNSSGSIDYADYSTSVVRNGNGGALSNYSSIFKVFPTHAQQTGSEIDEKSAATEGGSTVRSEIIGGIHRFTLIKPGVSKTKNANASGAKSAFLGSPSKGTNLPGTSRTGNSLGSLDSFFTSGFSFGVKNPKCDLCSKRLGWQPFLECDDCGLR